MVGRTLGHYDILEPLGAGGMGEVYRARDTKLDRDVAIKVLPDDLAADAERLARFEREAKLLAALNHSNIGAIYGLEETDSVHFLVLELIEGESLERRLRRGAMPVPEALDIARQIAEALEAAHDAGIIHRDVKPANVLLTGKGGVKVLDFGIAKRTLLDGRVNAALTEQATSLTVDGTLMGTPPYMAPEQIRGQEADRRADIWAFGCVVYEMLAGKAAFARETVADTLVAVLDAEPVWEALPASVPRVSVTVLQRCLRKDPNRRLRDIGDARIELEEGHEDAGGGTAVDATPVSARRAWLQAIPWVVAAAAVVVAALAIHDRAEETGGATVHVPAFPDDVQIQGLGNDIRGFEISPDGNRLAYFQSDPDGRAQLHAKTLDQLEGTPIAPPQSVDGNLAFSPTGDQIAFTQGDKLYRMSAQGGARYEITTLPRDVRGVSWGPDGYLVLGLGLGGEDSGLARVSMGGEDLEYLTHDEAAFGHKWPQVLPGGDAVVFTIGWDNFDEAAIAVLDIETRSVTELGITGTYPRYVPTGHLLYARHDSLYAVPFDPERRKVRGSPTPVLEGVIVNNIGNGSARYAVSDTGVLVYGVPGSNLHEFTVVDRQGHAEPLGFPVGRYGDFDLSDDGRFIVSMYRTPEWTLRLFDLETKTSRPLATPAYPSVPVIWPNGDGVSFSAYDSAGIQKIFSMPLDGSGPAVETTGGIEARDWPQSATPDGDVLVFHAGGDLYAVELDGGTEPQLLAASDELDQNAELSPDGKHLAFSSGASGRREVYVLPYPDDGAWGPLGRRISLEGGANPVWGPAGPGGRELFFSVTPRGHLIMVTRVRTEPELTWETPTLLFELPGRRVGNSQRSPYFVMPDGEHFVCLLIVGEEPSRLRFKLNWFEELKRLVPTDGPR